MRVKTERQAGVRGVTRICVFKGRYTAQPRPKTTTENANTYEE
jgi:hypothetical protein